MKDDLSWMTPAMRAADRMANIYGYLGIIIGCLLSIPLIFALDYLFPKPVRHQRTEQSACNRKPPSLVCQQPGIPALSLQQPQLPLLIGPEPLGAVGWVSALPLRQFDVAQGLQSGEVKPWEFSLAPTLLKAADQVLHD